MSEFTTTGAVLQKTASGAGWLFAWRAVTRGLGFINTLVLARLLMPADFGLVALAMSFSQALDALVDLGVQEAVVRAPDPSPEFYDTAFTLNLLRGASTTMLLAVAAYPAASFFGEPRLAPVLLVLAASVLLGGFENIGIADFRREFTFQNEFQLWVIPRVTQVIVTISVGYFWRSYWVLVLGILTARVLRNVGSYLLHPYRPRMTLRAWRQLSSFSFWSWLIGMLGLIRSRTTVLVIGRMLGPANLGVYSLGAELAALPESELIDPLCRVSFSSFAATQRMGTNAAATAYLRIAASTLAITLPAGIGMALTAYPIVALAFGPKWQAATPVVQVLAVAGIFNVLGRIATVMFSAYAHFRSMFGANLAMMFVQVGLTLLLVWQWGILGAAAAMAATTIIEQTIYCGLTFRRLHLRIHDLARRIWRPMLATLIMAIALVATGLSGSAGPVSLGGLLGICAAGAGVYASALLALWGACGRPSGAEADLLEVAQQASRHLLRRCLRLYRPRIAGPK